MPYFPKAAPLANLADRFGRLSLLDNVMSEKERDLGHVNSTVVFDLMNISLSDGECIDDLNQLRLDGGLVRLPDRKRSALYGA